MTLITVGENTTMKVEAFLQEPFDAAGTLLELKEEPSASNILIDLEIWDIVVRTKKLNAKSFRDHHPGRDGGHPRNPVFHELHPGPGHAPRDVTGIGVSFRPRAGGALRMVGAGRGLTAPPRMNPAERPVAPQATRRINRSRNDKAVISTRRLPMTFVRKSMSRATNRKPPCGKNSSRGPGPKGNRANPRMAGSPHRGNPGPTSRMGRPAARRPGRPRWQAQAGCRAGGANQAGTGGGHQARWD